MTLKRGPTPPAGVRLTGTGMATLGRIVTNDELAKTLDTNDQWITQRTGIKQRRVVDAGTTERHLAKEALTMAIDRAGITPGQLDLVICATMTPEMSCPSTASRLVAELGAVPAGAIDISAACSGFVYGLNMASCMVETGRYRTVAVVGTEVFSQILDWQDRNTCVLFGDGAGAAIVTASDNPNQGCLYQSMASNGDYWHLIYVPRKEEHIPPNGVFNGSLNTLQMNGREVYKFAVTTLQRMIEKTLDETGLTPSDLAMIVPHQSNQRILESVRDKLGLPAEKVYINVDRHGNTSAASIPIALHELMESGRLEQGDLVLFAGLGGGLTWSSSLWRL